MTWAIQIKYDADQDDVGSISATWTDQIYGDFTYPCRIKASQSEVTIFITDAIAARDTWQGKQLASVNKAAIVLDQINALDPKVGA